MASITLTLTPGAARAQGEEELPAVTASPVDPGAPNGGQWFAVGAGRGETVAVVAQVANPAESPQTVTLYLADLTIGDEESAVGARDAGVGAWGGFDEPQQLLGANGVVRASFHLTVPDDAEPGDHIGAVVAESGASGAAGGVGVVKRVAARLYVTVPGDADPRVEIESLASHLDRALLPQYVISTFLVRNTGNVRLETEVSVNGRRADGPSTIVSESAEAFEVHTPLSIWGGRKTIDVRVVTRTSTGEGPTATTSGDVLVIPWWILVAAFLGVVGALTVRELRRRLR